MLMHVECHAGYRGEETPLRLFFGERAVDVTEVVDRWLAPDHRYFKVKGADGATYILRHDTETACWALVMYDRNGRQMLSGAPWLTV
jgi:hypothetical protein